MGNKAIYKGKEYPSIKALVRAESDLEPGTVLHRLRVGWSLEKAITTPAVIIYKGREYPSIKALVRAESDLEPGTVLHRLRLGWSLGKALNKPTVSRGGKKLTYKGKTYSAVKELVSEQSDLPYWLVTSRLKEGWTLEKALKEPKSYEVVQTTFDVDGIEYNSLKALSDAFGVPYNTAYRRWRRGWPDHEIAHGRQKRKKKSRSRNESKWEITFQGKTYKHQSELCAAYGVKLSTFKTRLTRRGWSLEEALGIVPRDGRKLRTQDRGRGKSITCNGQVYPSIKAMAEAFEIPLHTVYARLKTAWTPEQAIGLESRDSPTSSLGRPITCKGKRYESVSELARSHKLPIATVRMRITRGWTPEQAAGLDPPPGNPRNVKSITCDGQVYPSIRAMAEAFEIPLHTVYGRLKAGWTPEQATGLESRDSPTSSLGRPITCKGKTYKSVAEFAKSHNVPDGTARNRLARGWTPEQAAGLDPPPGNPGHVSIEFEGVTYPSKSALARAYGLEPWKVANRLKAGWTLSQVLGVESPPHGEKRNPIEVGGKSFRSLAAAARQYDIPSNVVRHRLDIGWTHEQAFGLEPRPGAVLVSGKHYDSLADAAREYGVDPRSASYRRDAGWSLEQALGLEEREPGAFPGKYNEAFFRRNPEVRNEPAIVYLVSLEHKTTGECFEKIGITTRSVKSRFSRADSGKYRATEVATSGKIPLLDAWKLEGEFFELYQSSRFTAEDRSLAGRTECFRLSERELREAKALIESFGSTT